MLAVKRRPVWWRCELYAPCPYCGGSTETIGHMLVCVNTDLCGALWDLQGNPVGIGRQLKLKDLGINENTDPTRN